MKKNSELNEYEKRAMERMRQLMRDYCDNSQQRMVERTGVNKASISQYLNGKNVPSSLTATKIAKAFGVNPEWLMGFDAPMRGSATTPPVNLVSKDLRKYVQMPDVQEDEVKPINISEIEKALDLYEKFKSAIPSVQNAIEVLLKGSQSET